MRQNRARRFFTNTGRHNGRRKKKEEGEQKKNKTAESMMIHGNDDRLGIGSMRATLLT